MMSFNQNSPSSPVQLVTVKVTVVFRSRCVDVDGVS